MGMFQGNKLVEGSRSNTGGLLVSGVVAPAVKFIVDPKFDTAEMSSVFQNGKLFDYTAGGYVNQEVVIPLGRLVGVGKPVVDQVTGNRVPTITLPGISNNNNTIGIAPFNYYKDGYQKDLLSGNQPTVVTHYLVRVPYIPGYEPKTMNLQGLLQEEKDLSINGKMPWGSVIGGNITEGDNLKSSPSGRFCKWIKGTDDASDIVGQVWSMDLNRETTGWMKWMLWSESVLANKSITGDDKVINRSGSSEFPDVETGWPYNELYYSGDTTLQQYQTEFVTNPTGIPGLHDGSGNYTGYGINDTPYDDIEIGEVPGDASDGLEIIVNALDYAGYKVSNLQPGATVKIDGVELPADRYTVDALKGTFRIKLTTADAGKKITATYKMYRYGTPTYLDFKGVVGAVYILLKF